MRRLGLSVCILLCIAVQKAAVADRAADLGAAPTPEALVAMVISSENAEIVTYHHDGGFAVTYSLNPWLLTVGTARTALYMHTQELVPALFERLPDIDTVIIEANARMVDIKGNEKQDLVATITFSRDNSATINWKNIDLENIPRIADGAWIHRALKE